MAPGEGALDDAEREELERLRAEVDDLRAEASGAAGGRGGGRARRRARWTVAVALVVLASLLAPVTLVARYARDELLDTDKYVATVAPLAEDPALQAAVTDIVTTRLMDRLDVEDLARQALDALTEQGAPDAVTALAVPLADQVEGFVRTQVARFLATQAFADLWEQANRAAHTQLDAALTGSGDGVVSTDDGVVRVDLGEVVSRIQQRLEDRGFGLASNIPTVTASVTLVQSDELARAQDAVRWLDRVATALPLVILLLVGLAVAVAPGRRRALVWAIAGMTVTVLVVGLTVAAARSWYLESGNTRLPADAAESVIRTLLAPLRESFRATLLVGLAVLLVLFVTGPSASAVRIRALAGRAGNAVAGLASGVGRPSGVEAAVAANKVALQVAGAGLGVVALALWSYPGPVVVLTVLVLVGAWAALVEFVARSGSRPGPEPASPVGG